MTEHDVQERFYYADGQKVMLEPSRRFVAVQRPEEAERSDEPAAAVARALAPFADGARVLDLPEHGLAVIVLPTNGNGATGAASPVSTVRAAVEAAADVAAGPEVYETTEAGPEALVAIDEVLVKFKEETPEDARSKLLARHHLAIKEADYPEPDCFLVTIENGKDPIEVANALHDNDAVEFAEPHFVVITPRLEAAGGGNGVTMLPAPPFVRLEEGAASDELATDGGEAAIEMPAAGPTAPPTDPGYPSQWGLRKIRAPGAWDITMGRPDISVAIIDEGCDLSHEDLVFKTPGWDAYAGDNDPSPLPADGHGTSCSGVAAARANNAKGGAGVAPGCKILPVRIAKGIGGGYWDTSSAKVADGIRKAVDRGADVLSNSYGVGPSTVVTNAFAYAQTNGRGGRGCPIAAATGNGDVRGVIYPAKLSPTIRGFMAVGASNEWDQRKSKTSLDGESWWGSNWGPEVDVVAPGVHIYTTDIMGGGGYGSGNYIPGFNGTSSATPHVAGVAALVLSVDPDLRSWEVEDLIKLTADDLGAGGRDEQFGFGRVNARRALEAASRIWYEITIGVEFLGAGRECYTRANVRMFNPGINTVRLDALTLTSHTPSWTAEIDRFEYRPNPGNVLAPRSGQDVRHNGILLKANGNQQSWSYRWALNWTYTFWRPSAPAFALAPIEGAAFEAAGRTLTSRGVRGGADSPRVQPASPDSAPGSATAPALPTTGGNGAFAAGDLVSIDRQTRAITIVIR